MKFLSFVVGMSVAGLFVLPARADQTVTQNAATHFTIVINGPESAKVGKSVVIGITSINNGSSTIVGGHSISVELNHGVYVLDPQGSEPKMTAYGMNLAGIDESPELKVHTSMMRFSVPPGHLMQERLDLTSIYKLDSPGAYLVQIRDELPDGSSIKSNTIVIKVFP